MTRAAVAVVVAAAAASAVHKNVRWKRLWKRFDGFVAIQKKDVRDYKSTQKQHGDENGKRAGADAAEEKTALFRLGATFLRHRMISKGSEELLLQAIAGCNNMMKRAMITPDHSAIVHNANSPWYDHVSRASDCLTATASTAGHFRTASYHSSRVGTSTDKKEAATGMVEASTDPLALTAATADCATSNPPAFEMHPTIQYPAQARSETTTSQHETNWKISLETRSEQENGEEALQGFSQHDVNQRLICGEISCRP
ncbi:uncharacterized protein SEPMUDRAFT_136479 [Sphaerulina musiva SO2202]|uniref:Uncharacterized protein n=1 Tax=Sphaerulina musiva (strain SO2202) TaxID=692275 RepID=M3AS01_SPHMS|nr:uncharacterized protein SEPMUDRAFT_136479 [Sphaerulina musiva SO2202]EMF08284.1 hypothetical protein SEPMUDRAFT_136479 [Sphaerulina musiva SO2202]